MIASTLVPSPPSGLPPQKASGTSSPTIWRTMSAVPSATCGECETMTMPTLLMLMAHAAPTRRDDGRDDQRARARARVHVADRALAEEGGAAADRLHRHWSLPPRRARGRDRRIRAAAGERSRHRRQHIEHGLLARPPTCRAPSPRRSPRAKASARSSRVGASGSSLPSAMNSVP